MRKENKIWLILVSLTLLSYLIGQFHLLKSGSIVVLLLITLVKGELIIDYFMGLKKVRLLYRLIPLVWLIFVLSLILLAYYL
jgi:caa(3)-type oxidase subunit IV